MIANLQLVSPPRPVEVFIYLVVSLLRIHGKKCGAAAQSGEVLDIDVRQAGREFRDIDSLDSK